MLEVDKKTFEDEVLKAEGYVFVDFFGDGCVPCQALMPFVHEMADKYGVRHIMHFGQLHTLSAQSILSRTKQIKAHIFHQSNAECFRITDNGQSFPLVPQLQISFLHQIFSIGSILQ